MRSRLNGDKRINRVNADEIDREVTHLRQACHNFLAPQVTQIEVNRLPVGFAASPFIDFALL